MYLHLGQDTVIKTDDIIGIFDLDTSTISKHTRAYLALCERAGEVINVTSELPKSFVLCCEKSGKRRVYISQLSSATLKGRAGKPRGTDTAGRVLGEAVGAPNA